MNVYVKDYIIPSSLFEGASVVFILNTEEKYTYRICKKTSHPEWCFMENLRGLNEEIFKALGIEDKYSFIKEITGYTPKNGDFPYVKIQDLRKVILALTNYNNPNKRLINSGDKKEDKFTLSVKKHKQTKLNFKL